MISAHDWPVYWSQSGVVEDFVAQETDLQAKEKKRRFFCCIRSRKWIKRDQQPISMSGIHPRLIVKIQPPKRFVTIKMDYLAVILQDHTWVNVSNRSIFGQCGIIFGWVTQERSFDVLDVYPRGISAYFWNYFFFFRTRSFVQIWYLFNREYHSVTELKGNKWWALFLLRPLWRRKSIFRCMIL